MIIGPFIKHNISQKVLYALDADEHLMMGPREGLSPDELNIEQEYREEMSGYGLSILGSTDPGDGLIINSRYREQTETLNWLRAMYGKMGLAVTESIYFADPGNFYKQANEILKSHSYDAVSSTSFSYPLREEFDVANQLDTSAVVNKKTSLLALSKKYGFSIPRSIVYIPGKTKLEDIEDYAADTLFPLYVKGNGLGGGANVKKLKSFEEIKSLASMKIPVLIQESVPDGSIEVSWTALIDDDVELMHFRAKLMHEGGTYGSVYHPDLKPAQHQRENVMRAFAAIREEGYRGQDGYCAISGCDSFISGNDFFITEINSRWLGSTRYDLLLKKLNVLGKIIAVPMTDKVDIEEIEKYKVFVERYLYGSSTKTFSLIPVSFSAYETGPHRTVSYIVCGSLYDFAEVVQKEFSRESFPLLSGAVQSFTEVVKQFGLRTSL